MHTFDTKLRWRGILLTLKIKFKTLKTFLKSFLGFKSLFTFLADKFAQVRQHSFITVRPEIKKLIINFNSSIRLFIILLIHYSHRLSFATFIYS